MSDTHTLRGRIAVVTGASAGIGEAIAREIVRRGGSCVLNARRRDRLESLAKELGSDRAGFVAGDCADPALLAKLLDHARDRFGGATREPDLIVANAGRGLSGSVITSDTSQWGEMLRTNVLGAAHLIREAGERFLREVEGLSGQGVLARPRDILVLGSTVGRHISPFSSMYGSTKFAVNSLAEAARRELGPRGVRVTLIEPGFVVSEFQGVAGYDPKWFDEVQARIGPPLTPLDVARASLFPCEQPPHVHVSDVLIRPTRQDYP